MKEITDYRSKEEDKEQACSCISILVCSIQQIIPISDRNLQLEKDEKKVNRGYFRFSIDGAYYFLFGNICKTL